jgi:hypothetical protein
MIQVQISMINHQQEPVVKGKVVGDKIFKRKSWKVMSWSGYNLHKKNKEFVTFFKIFTYRDADLKVFPFVINIEYIFKLI